MNSSNYPMPEYSVNSIIARRRLERETTGQPHVLREPRSPHAPRILVRLEVAVPGDADATEYVTSLAAKTRAEWSPCLSI